MGDILLKVEENVLPNLAKAIMAKTGKSEPLTLLQFQTEVESISGGGLENGYDVMFYDENNEAIAFTSIRQGDSMQAPIYVCDGWKTSDEQIILFPYTPTQDMVLYAFNEDLAQRIYEHYGVDIQEYPYVTMQLYKAKQSTPRCLIAFSTTETPATSDYIFGSYEYYSDSDIQDKEDVGGVMDFIIGKILPTSLTQQYAINFYLENSNQEYSYMYTNYERTPNQSSTIVYRLNE